MENLRFAAARRWPEEQIDLLIEPINTFDIPGFFLNAHPAGGGPDRARSAPTICACSTTSITCSAWRAKTRRDAQEANLAEDRATCSWRTAPAATSRARASSTTRFLFRYLDEIGYTRLDRLRVQAQDHHPRGRLGWRTPQWAAVSRSIERARGRHSRIFDRETFLADQQSASSASASWARRWRATCCAAGPHAVRCTTSSRRRRAAGGRRRDHRAPAPRRWRRRADIIVIMVPDTPHVEAVLFADKGVAAALRTAGKGKIVVDMSSISPIATKDFATHISELGASYLDAPVSGGEVGAKAASLTIMVGGPAEALRAGQAAVRADGQEHHAGRRQRRRPDHQGGQPDHRGADHRGGRPRRCCSPPRLAPTRPRCARR